MDAALIERLAREAGGQFGGEFELNVPAPVWVFDAEDLSAFAALVAAHERERCAEVCEQWDASHPHRLAAAIRAL